MRWGWAVLVGAVWAPVAAWADLFGYAAVQSTNIQSLPKWTDVLARTTQENLRSQCQQNACDGLRARWWEELETWRGLNRMSQLVRVNRWHNRQPYTEDRDNWGRSDYWTTPRQFLTRSGDCEDYSIAKYYTLRALGWPEAALRLAVVRDTVRGIAHAVLVAELEGTQYILDNLADEPLPERYVRQYAPYYAVNAAHRWVFVPHAD